MSALKRRSFLKNIFRLSVCMASAQAGIYVVGEALASGPFGGRMAAGAKGLYFDKGIELMAPCAACDQTFMGPYATPAACETARSNWLTSGSSCSFCKNNYTSPSCY